MKRRFSLFTYPMMDMRAAEAELNRRAAAGWTAEWCRRQLGAAGQPPLEGYEGVWHNAVAGNYLNDTQGYTTIYPIPYDVMSLNKNLKQNPGY